MKHVFAGALALGLGAARLGAQAPVPAAARDIARGVELSAADIAGDTLARIGWVTRRVIHEGEKLTEPGVVPPKFMRAGAAVTVQFESGGVVVTRAGTALSDSAPGKSVRVRIDAQHVVTGIVTGSATVKVQ